MSPILPSDAPTADATPPTVSDSEGIASATAVIHSGGLASAESDLDDGVDFFSVQGARDRAKLEGRG